MAKRPGILVDVLDRIAERGLYLGADLVICVADVPLLALNLRAAIASIDTAIEYGMYREKLQDSSDGGDMSAEKERKSQTDYRKTDAASE